MIDSPLLLQEYADYRKLAATLTDDQLKTHKRVIHKTIQNLREQNIDAAYARRRLNAIKAEMRDRGMLPPHQEAMDNLVGNWQEVAVNEIVKSLAKIEQDYKSMKLYHISHVHAYFELLDRILVGSIDPIVKAVEARCQREGIVVDPHISWRFHRV